MMVGLEARAGNAGKYEGDINHTTTSYHQQTTPSAGDTAIWEKVACRSRVI